MAALTAARAAKRQGVPISFDGNYRAMLWEAWDSDPRAVLSELIGLTDILFGNHRDLSLVLEQGPDRRWRDEALPAGTPGRRPMRQWPPGAGHGCCWF